MTSGITACFSLCNSTIPYLSSVLSVRERFDFARPVSASSSLNDLLFTIFGTQSIQMSFTCSTKCSKSINQQFPQTLRTFGVTFLPPLYTDTIFGIKSLYKYFYFFGVNDSIIRPSTSLEGLPPAKRT